MKRVGIDLGGHFIKGALLEEGVIRKRLRLPTPPGREPEDVVRAVSRMIRDLDPEASASSVGVGFPGMLDRVRNIVLLAPNFPLLVDYPFRARTEEEAGQKIFLENDANCAALGEWRSGSAKGLEDFVMFTLGTGIGGGIISGGRIVTGGYGKAAEMGHIPVGDGALCGCGSPGHAEAFFGADALRRTFREAGIDGEVRDLWKRRREPRESKIWNPALEALSRAIAAAVHILDPQAVVLGGGLSRAEGLVEEIRPLVMRFIAPPFQDTLDIRLSSLGDDAALVGASGLG